MVLVVDPIDGTRGFMTGHAAWAIVLALVEDGRPLFESSMPQRSGKPMSRSRGPALDSTTQAIEVSKLRALGPRQGWRHRCFSPSSCANPGSNSRCSLRFPSLALRFAKVASGALDAGFASENSHDWDIAAADLILHEAGGRLASLDGCAIVYNRPDTRHGLLTAAPTQIHAEVNAAARWMDGRVVAQKKS